jgi:ATP-dependent DNA helicase RecG
VIRDATCRLSNSILINKTGLFKGQSTGKIIQVVVDANLTRVRSLKTGLNAGLTKRKEASEDSKRKLVAMAKKKYTTEELMQMAIEESRLSIAEHLDKTDPLVGAIITTAEGEILAKAHRGELRVGEHCEYTLIERKLVRENLNGCVLYVTLELCTDKSRNKGGIGEKIKRGCSTHAVKARLGKVYVGIEDPNPKIANEGIAFLREQGVTVHMFPENLQEIIRADNKRFIEEKEEEAKQGRIQEVEEPKNLLQRGAPGTNIRSFSDSVVLAFIETASMPFGYPSDDFNQWGLEFGILEKDEDSETLQPTGLGLMLFGARPEQTFPQTVFKVEINYGRGNSEIKDFGGALVTQLPAILDYVRDKALKLTMDTSKGVRKEEPDFPFEVLREAIANAVIHRDYTIESATNYLYIDPEKIIVRSPGEPAPPLTLQELQGLDAPSVSRNPKIMYIFNQMGLAEQRGVGLRKLKHLPEEGFPLPTLSMRGGMLEITFGRTKEFIAKQAGVRDISEAEEAGLLFVEQRGEVSRSEFARHFGITDKTAVRRLAGLIKKGLVETKGKAKATVYVRKERTQQNRDTNRDKRSRLSPKRNETVDRDTNRDKGSRLSRKKK